MSMQEPANHYRLGLKLGTYCDNAYRNVYYTTVDHVTKSGIVVSSVVQKQQSDLIPGAVSLCKFIVSN